MHIHTAAKVYEIVFCLSEILMVTNEIISSYDVQIVRGP